MELIGAAARFGKERRREECVDEICWCVICTDDYLEGRIVLPQATFYQHLARFASRALHRAGPRGCSLRPGTACILRVSALAG